MLQPLHMSQCALGHLQASCCASNHCCASSSGRASDLLACIASCCHFQMCKPSLQHNACSTMQSNPVPCQAQHGSEADCRICLPVVSTLSH